MRHEESGVPDPGSDAVQPEPERTRGLAIEHCYRHPSVTTGVHCTRCGRPICTDCMHSAAIGYQCPDCLAQARREGGRRATRLTLGRGRRNLTTGLMILNGVVFVIEIVLGGGLVSGPQTKTLLDLGAMQPFLIAVDHQYWRLITPIFLHAGLLHIAFNTYALYLFGYLIEDVFGPKYFLAIYFVAGFLASVASFMFSDPLRTVGVGASGAIFGLLGAWVAYNYRRRGSPLASANLQWALTIIGINLVLGVAIPHIDNFAHIGGLVAGAAAGTFAEGLGSRAVRPFVQVGGLIGLVLLGVALTAFRVSTITPF